MRPHFTIAHHIRGVEFEQLDRLGEARADFERA